MSHSLKVKVVKAKNLVNVDVLSYTDAKVLVVCDGHKKTTKIINNNLNPTWNEEFQFEINDPSTSFVSFVVWDSDAITKDDFVGCTSVSLNVLKPNETSTIDLPIFRSATEDSGILTVELTAGNWSGLIASVNKLEAAEKKITEQVQLLSQENNKYHELNNKLEGQVKDLTGQVTKFTAENDRYQKLNNQLEGQVTKMTAENDRHQKLNTQLEGEVKNLTGQVTKFTAENDRYQKLNNQLEGQVKDLTGQVTKFTAENDRYTKLNNQLNGEVNNLKEQNAKLDQTRKALEAGVDDLKKQVNKFSEENSRLEKTRDDLNKEVAQFSNKVKVLSGEITNLQKTREMLDEQVKRQEAQNNQFKDELKNLHTIEEGMKQFSAQQGSDYKQFVSSLTSSLNKHQQLLTDFASENDKLRTNRRKQQVDSLLALSNSFSSWDHKVGLSVDEFKSYMEMLGPEFQEKLAKKMGGTSENAFKRLDKDGSGSLNLQELRSLLEELVEEEKNH